MHARVQFCAMETFAIDASGRACVAGMLRMDAEWRGALSTGGGEEHALGLSCLFPWGQDAIYLFSSLERAQAPIEVLPAPVAELLLFPPLVPLKWQHGGFQAVSPPEWDNILTTQLSDRPPTTRVSAPVLPARDEAAVLSISSENDDDHTVSLSSENSDADLEDDINDDCGSSCYEDDCCSP